MQSITVVQVTIKAVPECLRTHLTYSYITGLSLPFRRSHSGINILPASPVALGRLFPG